MVGSDLSELSLEASTGFFKDASSLSEAGTGLSEAGSAPRSIKSWKKPLRSRLRPPHSSGLSAGSRQQAVQRIVKQTYKFPCILQEFVPSGAVSLLI